MARTRIFISSTYYDLLYVRDDLARFAYEMGYDPVLFERGSVPYANKTGLADNCYKEIETCDIVVSVRSFSA
ncbi:hypothetical protein D3C86_1668420 [compost metagenome]